MRLGLLNDRMKLLNKAISLFCSVVLGFLMGGVLLKSPVFAAIGMIAMPMTVLFFIAPHIIILALLILRSSLDIFTNVGLKIGPMMLNIPSLTSIFILLCGGVYIMVRFFVNRDIILDRVGKTFLFWVLTLLFWVYIAFANFGMAGFVGMREWVRLASLAVLYILTYSLIKKVSYETIINCLFFALPIPIVTAILQFFYKSGISANGIKRVYGTLAHPNPFALFLVFFIGLTLWKIKSGTRIFIWYVLLALELFVLIITFSIVGMIMLLVVLVILGINVASKKYRLTIIALIFISLFSFSVSEFGKQRLSEVSNTGSFSDILKTGRASGGGSFAWRILNWSLFAKEWAGRPFLGYGLHATEEKVSPLANIPHNDYLRFLVETGIIGFSLYLFLLSVVGRSIWEAYRRYSVSDLRLCELALVNFSVFIAWLIGSFSDNYITATVFQYYFWTLTAVVLGMARFQDKRIGVIK